MAKDFNLPDLGENITTGDVVQVLVKEGDVIQPEQAVLELETEKAVLEVPCPFGGKVTKIHVKAGDKVKVGAPVISVEAAAGAEAPPPSRPQQAQKEEDQRGDTASPAEMERKTPGASEGAAAAPSASERAGARSTPEAPARKPPSRPGKSAKAEPAEVPSPREALRAAPSAPPKAAVEQAAQQEVPAGPATRRLARELGVNLEAVAQMFPGQRLTDEHIKTYVREGAAAPSAGAAHAEPPMPDLEQWGKIERTPLSSLQRKTAEHLTHSWVAPHVTQFDLADVTALESLRKRYRQHGAAKNIKLTVTAFVVKAVAQALREFPTFNSSLDMAAGELVLKQYYHIGVAVDTEAGLIVPVIRDADTKRVLEIAEEMEEIADRTRRRKIKLEELQGGTFTITNLGGIGGTAFTPVLNYPEVAILGLARSREEPVVTNGQLSTRLVLPLCLSYDHRVINGADGARFIRKIATLLEDPELLLLD
jgi:pyruvate dehydrogenase E2 component (dihydrolipoamide acetyltransferase)